LAITVLADLRFKPEALEPALRSFPDVLKDTRAYEGCLSLSVVQDQADPTHVVLVERWESAAGHHSYMAWRAETGSLEALAAGLVQEPSFTYYDELLEL